MPRGHRSGDHPAYLCLGATAERPGMGRPDGVAPDMSDWNSGVIAEFRANEGKVGGYFEGAPMILLHHIGARSGTVRVTPLVYFPQDDGSMLVVASKGGAPTNPDWYHNVLANPRFEVEVGTRDVHDRRRGAQPRRARRALARHRRRATRLRRLRDQDDPGHAGAPRCAGVASHGPQSRVRAASGCCAGCARPRRARAPRAAAAGTSRPGRGSPCAGRTSRHRVGLRAAPGLDGARPWPASARRRLPSGTQSPCSRSQACRSSTTRAS